MAATRKDLEAALSRINRNSNKEFYFDWMGRRPRVCFMGREISPRLSSGEMMRWLDAFEVGLDYSGAGKLKDALVAAPTPPFPFTNEPSPKIAEILLQWMAEYKDWFEGQRVEAQQLKSNNEARMIG